MPGEPLDAPGGGVGFCPRGVPAAQGAPRPLARKMPAAQTRGSPSAIGTTAGHRDHRRPSGPPPAIGTTVGHRDHRRPSAPTGRDSVTGLKSAVRARRAENADERPRGMKVTRGTKAKARDVGDEG